MKKIASIDLYGFVQLYRAFKERFPGYNFEENSTTAGYFQIDAAPGGKRGDGEIVLEVFDPVYPDNNPEPFFDEMDIADQTITIGFFVTQINTFRYKINKVDLDNNEVIEELRKLIGQVAPVRHNSDTWNDEVENWAKKTIADSPVFKYLTAIN